MKGIRSALAISSWERMWVRIMYTGVNKIQVSIRFVALIACCKLKRIYGDIRIMKAFGERFGE